MKKALIIIILVFVSISLFSQNWQNIDQKYLGMKYDLPEDWEIDGFGGGCGYWEEYGSSVCYCAGTINIGKRYSEKEIFMVVYPVQIKDSVNTIKRNMVWGMIFDENGSKSIIKTKKYTFEKNVSIWKPETDYPYSGNEVWKLYTSSKNQYYIIYFWAKPEVMKENEKIIAQILESFRIIECK